MTDDPHSWSPPEGSTAWEQAADEPGRERRSDRADRFAVLWLPLLALGVLVAVALAMR